MSLKVFIRNFAGKRKGHIMTKDNQEQINAIMSSLERLRKVTAIMKISPFLYSLLYIVCMSVYLTDNKTASTICSITFYVSPLVVFLFFKLSSVLGFCKWHKMQCLIPLLPQVFMVTDKHFHEFGCATSDTITIGIIVIIVISIINGFFVFQTNNDNDKGKNRELSDEGV